MRRPRALAGLALAAACLAPGAAAAEVRYEASWASLDARACPAWYLDAKFGIFIHWGVYSVPAWGVKGEYAEWYWNRIADKRPDNPWWLFHKANYGEGFRYEDFAPRFRCELFDPKLWADILARGTARRWAPGATSSASWPRPCAPAA